MRQGLRTRRPMSAGRHMKERRGSAIIGFGAGPTSAVAHTKERGDVSFPVRVEADVRRSP